MTARSLSEAPGGLRQWIGFDRMVPKPKTARQHEADRRRRRREDFRRQIEAGTLTVRQMTSAERERHPRPDRGLPKPRWK